MKNKLPAVFALFLAIFFLARLGFEIAYMAGKPPADNTLLNGWSMKLSPFSGDHLQRAG